MKTGIRLLTGIWTLFLALGLTVGSYAQNQEVIYTKPFTRIEVGSMLHIYLVPSDTHKVVIEPKQAVDDNKLEISVDNGKLEFEAGWNLRKSDIDPEDVNISISYVELESISAGGVAQIKTKGGPITTKMLNLKLEGASETHMDVAVEELNTEISGAAKLKIRGKATHHQLDASGAANVKGYDLDTKSTHADVSGAAMAYVKATDKLTGSIKGVAQLQYEEEAEFTDINKSKSMEKIVEREVSRRYYDDSVRVKVGKFDIEVIDSDTTHIKLGRSHIKIDEKGNVDIGREKEEREFDGHWTGFGIGVNGYLTDDNSLTIPEPYKEMDLTYEKSINVQLNVFEQSFNLIRERFGLVTGLGLQWNNYRFDNNVVLEDEPDFLAFTSPDPTRNYEKSKLVVNYLTLPLFLEYQTNSDNDISSFHLSAGAVGALRIGAHSKNIIGGSKSKQRTDFHLSPFSADAMVRIGWGKINLYAAYGLLPLFKEDEGPELYPFRIGITLTDF